MRNTNGSFLRGIAFQHNDLCPGGRDGGPDFHSMAVSG